MTEPDARHTSKTLGLFVLWIALMTLAGWYGRGQEPGQAYRVPPAQCQIVDVASAGF